MVFKNKKQTTKKKKHNKIVMLARSKLNSIESKISKALMDNEISHESFETIINHIQDGLFWGCSRMGGGKTAQSLKSVTHILK